MEDTNSSSQIDDVPRFEIHHLLGVIGFGFFLAWSISVLTNPLLYKTSSTYTSSYHIRLIYFIASLLTLAICFALSSYILTRRALTVGLIFLVCCSSLAGCFDYFGSLPPFTLEAFWLLSGIGTSILLVFWGIFLSTLNHIKSLLYPAISVGIATCLLMLNTLMIEKASVMITVSFPVLSLITFLLERRTKTREKGTTLFKEFRYKNGKPSFRQSSMYKAILGTFCNSVSLGFAFYYMSSIGNTKSIVFCYAVILAASILRAVDAIRWQTLDVRFALRMIAPCAAVGMLPLAFSNMNLWLLFCGLLLGVSWLNDMINWSEITEHTRVNQTIPSLIVSFDRIGNLGGIAIGYFIAFYTFGGELTNQLSIPIMPSLVVIALICIQAFVLAGNYSYQFTTNQEIAGTKSPAIKPNYGPWRYKCEEFAKRNHLSQRETEVLLLLAKGRDTSYIEESLIISSHTVKAHIYNIYRKTDVHSRQELISQIESFQPSDQRVFL